jgi:hypothetical protein
VLGAIAVVLLPLLSLLAATADTVPIVFIVNSENPQTTIDRGDLIDYYEKKRRLWPNGVGVRFVDHIPGSPERLTFLKLLNTTESDLQVYWSSEKLRSGTRMPIQTPSDRAVVEQVRSLNGAIGYVASGTPLPPSGVKIVKITGPSQ